MAEFVAVAKLSEVRPGQLKHRELDEGTQVSLANVDGTRYAIDGECTHMGGSLGGGEREGTTVTCPLHSSEFDVTSGDVKGPPADEPQGKFEVRVEGEEVQVAAW